MITCCDGFALSSDLSLLNSTRAALVWRVAPCTVTLLPRHRQVGFHRLSWFVSSYITCLIRPAAIHTVCLAMVAWQLSFLDADGNTSSAFPQSGLKICFRMGVRPRFSSFQRLLGGLSGMALELAGSAALSLPLSFESGHPLLRLRAWRQLFLQAVFHCQDRLLRVQRECAANRDPRRNTA